MHKKMWWTGEEAKEEGMENTLSQNRLYNKIASILEESRKFVATTVNTTMVQTYFEIGRLIVEEEQQGHVRAAYGKETLKKLSEKLTANYGKGFSQRNLEQMRQFFLTYSTQISQTPSSKFTLSYSHYLFLMRIDNPDERRFYEIEATASKWSLRELKRQFDSALYERLSLSSDKEKIKSLAAQGQIIESPRDIVKDPYVLEFLGLPEKSCYSESELESHQDLGQMQMYVNYYDRFVKLDHENKTIGIILCKKKSDSLVEITLPEDNDQIFASKYQTVLPNKEDLIKLIQAEN